MSKTATRKKIATKKKTTTQAGIAAKPAVTASVVVSSLYGRPSREGSSLTPEQHAEVHRLAVANADIAAAREWKERETVALGGAKSNSHPRVGSDHGIADMLRLVLATDGAAGDDMLSDGIVAAADDLLAFVDWIVEGGGAEYDGKLIQRVGDGIQHRLRVLAELARRMRDAVDSAKAVA